MEMTLVTPYIVCLRDYNGLPDKDRMAAEVRFCRVVERHFGTAEEVAQAVATAKRFAEDSSGEVDAKDLALNRRWLTAYDAARQAGFNGLGESQEAYFDVVT